MKLVLVFTTTHNALAAEAALSGRAIAREVLPTPREISVSCGISIQLDKSYLAKVLELAETHEINVLGVYMLDPGSEPGKREYIGVWGATQ